MSIEVTDKSVVTHQGKGDYTSKTLVEVVVKTARRGGMLGLQTALRDGQTGYVPVYGPTVTGCAREDGALHGDYDGEVRVYTGLNFTGGGYVAVENVEVVRNNALTEADLVRGATALGLTADVPAIVKVAAAIDEALFGTATTTPHAYKVSDKVRITKNGAGDSCDAYDFGSLASVGDVVTLNHVYDSGLELRATRVNGVGYVYLRPGQVEPENKGALTEASLTRAVAALSADLDVAALVKVAVAIKEALA